MHIEKFRPPQYSRQFLPDDVLNGFWQKDLHYASMGRYALYHILKAHGVAAGKVLVPAYACASLLVPLGLLGLEPVFYDLDPRDLNADAVSVAGLISEHRPAAVVVASMYGNPADLAAIERLCGDSGVLLIDDAAQSFGAVLDSRPVGTFGQAGFFSLSPGKPTAGHMGAYFWTSNPDYRIKRTSHDLLHYVTYLDFFFNRLHIYETRSLKIFGLLRLLKGLAERFADIRDDAIASFERTIVGGVIQGQMNSRFAFRQKHLDRFKNELANNRFFRVLTNVRGIPSNHKLVVILQDRRDRPALCGHLAAKKIYCLNGYALLSGQADLPNCRDMDGRVFELPLEDHPGRMDYILETLKEFRGNYAD